MRFLLSTFIFLSSSTLWSTIYLVCDTSHIFYPDYEKRITFVLRLNYFSPQKIEIITYSYFDNKFQSYEETFVITPLEIFDTKFVIERQTGKLRHRYKEYNEDFPPRTCEKHEYLSWLKEKEKQDAWANKKVKDRKI